MAIYTVNITDNGGQPTASPCTAPDYTVQNGEDVPNSIQFVNLTAQTVWLNPGDNWATFFSQNSLTMEATGETAGIVLPLNLITSGITYPINVSYTLSYNSEFSRFGEK